MDWLTFIVEIVKATVWPGALIVAALLFRQPLYELIPLLKKLKYKELELEFSKEVLELKREVAESIPSDSKKDASLSSESNRYFQLAAI